MTDSSPPGPPDAPEPSSDPASSGAAAHEQQAAPHGRCAHAGCATQWATADGRPRPLLRAGTGRPPKFCSGDCKDADRRARQARPAASGDAIDGAVWVRQLGEDAGRRAPLIET
ncbi:hypothetical protein, partial [Nonomuraea recticatena]|uniref:hypothetical protein n=1 Tax=Nonomuraea recticatena TaxID=46178 RepID=UPI0031F8944E